MEQQHPNYEQIAIKEKFMKEKLHLDGRLIPIRKQIADKNLSLMIRHITYPFSTIDRRVKKQPNKSFLLINMFGSKDNQIENAGFIDWAISDNVALCTHAQSLVLPQSLEQRLAKGKYGADFMLTSFVVEPYYQREGVGSFMASLSLSLFKDLDINEFIPGQSVTYQAKGVWEKLGFAIPSHLSPHYDLHALRVNQSIISNIAKFV